MERSNKRLYADANLILHRTSRKDIEQGIPIIDRGDGIYVFDEEGNQYMDLDAGWTRPEPVGHGLRESAEAAFHQI